MKNIYVAVCGLVLIISVQGCAKGPSLTDLKANIAQLSNEDICWMDSSLGFIPMIISNRARLINQAGQRAVPYLVLALTNNNQYVAAHVLLSLSMRPHCNSQYIGKRVNLGISQIYSGLPMQEVVDDNGRGYVVFPPQGRIIVVNFWYGLLRQRSPVMIDIGTNALDAVRCEINKGLEK